MYPSQAPYWLFPADSSTGRIVEHKERRTVLSKWGNDLRQTYRTLAQAAGINEVDMPHEPLARWRERRLHHPKPTDGRPSPQTATGDQQFHLRRSLKRKRCLMGRSSGSEVELAESRSPAQVGSRVAIHLASGFDPSIERGQ